MPLTPGAQIDELRRALRESEQRRKAAEIKLADRQLGTASQTIAAQDDSIGRMAVELARLRGRATATALNAYALDFPQLFKGTGAR
jgi:hypothetical protein